MDVSAPSHPGGNRTIEWRLPGSVIVDIVQDMSMNKRPS